MRMEKLNEADGRFIVSIDCAIGISEETALKCLIMVQWFMDEHPEYSLHEKQDTVDGKVKHKLWFYKKDDDWKIGGK